MGETDGDTEDGAARQLDAYESTARAETSPARTPHEPRAFDGVDTSGRIGRYTVLRLLGEGGMGQVYAAYDEKLDRRVAVKVLRHDVNARSLARVQREARAMASLNHPNVVQVYEVAEPADQTFIAMEFVKGETLSTWQRENGRTWQEIVRVYLQAGEGLAAAHAAGLVHRDFKPNNAMVQLLPSGEPRARVLDFGLARRTGLPILADVSTDHPSSPPQEAVPPNLTATGDIAGTPAYMAPEQFSSSRVGERADQFSFCVALWEAVYGERPFAGATLGELAAAVTEGRRKNAPTGSRVPQFILTALTRGLLPSPADRWPSMRALIEALSRDPARRRSRWLAVGASAIVAAGLGLGLHQWTAARQQQCSGAADHLVGVWDETRRSEMRDAIVGIDAEYAELVWDRTGPVLDAYAGAWTRMHTEACEATTLRGEQSADAMDLRMQCLHAARQHLRAAVAVLVAADATVVRKAHEVVDGLPLLSRCGDLKSLRAAVEPPLADEAESVEEIRDTIAMSKAEVAAGRYDEAYAKLETARTAWHPIRSSTSPCIPRSRWRRVGSKQSAATTGPPQRRCGTPYASQHVGISASRCATPQRCSWPLWVPGSSGSKKVCSFGLLPKDSPPTTLSPPLKSSTTSPACST